MFMFGQSMADKSNVKFRTLLFCSNFLFKNEESASVAKFDTINFGLLLNIFIQVLSKESLIFRGAL